MSKSETFFSPASINQPLRITFEPLFRYVLQIGSTFLVNEYIDMYWLNSLLYFIYNTSLATWFNHFCCPLLHGAIFTHSLRKQFCAPLYSKPRGYMNIFQRFSRSALMFYHNLTLGPDRAWCLFSFN